MAIALLARISAGVHPGAEAHLAAPVEEFARLSAGRIRTCGTAAGMRPFRQLSHTSPVIWTARGTQIRESVLAAYDGLELPFDPRWRRGPALQGRHRAEAIMAG